MSLIPRCTVCDDGLNPYGQETRCARCSAPCPSCGGDVALCSHPLPLTEVEQLPARAGRSRIAA